MTFQKHYPLPRKKNLLNKDGPVNPVRLTNSYALRFHLSAAKTEIKGEPQKFYSSLVCAFVEGKLQNLNVSVQIALFSWKWMLDLRTVVLN